MAENTVKDLKEYFSTPENPVNAREMMDFWQSCSEDDKEYFKTADISS